MNARDSIEKMKNRGVAVYGGVVCVVLVAIITVTFLVNFISSHQKYSNDDFGIATFVSEKDKDMDGVDDQTDILASAKEYLATNPKYKSKYYAGGYSDDEYGVCTDVVALALLSAGYDLRELVDADIREHQDQYNIEIIDKNIDFRRVGNLQIFFENNAEVLTTDIHEIAEWQGGDIVVFQGHIGIVSDARNNHGVPFVFHHESPWQLSYEENILERREIVGHYRMGTKKLFAEYYEQAERIVSEMSLDEKVAAMFLVRFPDAHELAEIVAAKPGGFILFAKDFQNETQESMRKKLQDLQDGSDRNFIFGVDEEGGAVTRVSRFPAFRVERFAAPQDLYERGGIDLVVQDTREKSKLLKTLGINMNLAPVVDVSTQANAFIYDRTLGQDVQTTADYAKATIKAMKDEGIISAMKHFPGYGDNTDTHIGVARDKREYAELEKADLLPFMSGIRAGGPTILVSHNIIESIDDSLPASLSEPVHDILRNKLDFTGVIITDDLAMDAVKKYSAHNEAAVEAVLAGNDLIITSDFLKQKQEVLDAIKSDKISEAQIDIAVRRVIAMKMSYGIIRSPSGEISKDISTEATQLYNHSGAMV